jgi:O-antigen/teichoic acid export membrane protein
VLVRAARDDRDRLAYAVQRLLEVALIVGAWMALATYFFAPAAIDIVAGSGYEPSVSVLRIIGLALLGGFLGVTLGFTLLSMTAHIEILICNLVAFGAAVGLNLLLIPRMGADGAAVALAAADGILVACYGWQWLKKRGGHFDPRVVPRVAIAAGLAGALAAVPDVPAFALGVAATAVYLAAIVLLRAVPSELRDAFLASRQDSGATGQGAA